MKILKKYLLDIIVLVLFVIISFAYFFPADIEGKILYRHDSSAGKGLGHELTEYYEQTGRRFVSSHPMFGPTFANLQQLSEENAIIISEGDYMGRIFFKDLYQRLDLNIYEYTFDEHDRTVAYSLSIPFVSTFVFAAVMKHQDAPGTTFKRHMKIAKGVLNEDDYLLQEILFNPYTHDQVSQIRTELKELLEIIDNKDAQGMKGYLTKIRNNVKRDIEIKQ